MRRKFITMLLAAATIAFAACTANDTEIDDTPSPDGSQDVYDPNATLTVYGAMYDFDNYERDSQATRVVSNRDWKIAEVSDSWIHAKKVSDQQLTITVDESYQASTRQGTIVVKAAANAVATLTVRQLGYGKDILLQETDVRTEANGGVVTVYVTTNFDVAAESDAEWVSEQVEADTRASHPVKTKERYFVVDPNGGDKTRTATITFRENVDGDSDFEPVTFTISQKGFGDYSAGDPGPLEEVDISYVQVTPTSAEATDQMDGHGIELTYDGLDYTYFSTNYFTGTPKVTLYYYFDSERIDRITYIGRKDNKTDGNWRDVTVSYQTAGNSGWIAAGTYNCNGDTTISYKEPLRDVTAIQMVVSSRDNKYVTAAEVEFAKMSDAIFDYTTLFTDHSCMELREGVTDEDIAACKFMFYRNIARWLKDETYETEFRAETYHPRDDPYVQSRKEVAVPYSLVDNPTGMVVQKDEELIVLAELNGRTDVKLWVIEFDRKDYNDNGYAYRSEFKLVSGVNRLKMPRPGMLYVMYNVADWREAPDVRIHFASGAKVNGYYDSQKHGEERWRELLSKANNYRHYDVMGRFCHLVCEVGQFRTITSDLYDLAEIYDEMVYRQQVLCGLMRDLEADEFRHNRVLIYESYNTQSTAHAFMADCFIAVPGRPGSIDLMLRNTNLRGNPIAEMAHEVGHIHSNWFSRFAGTMTEVTNNNLQIYTCCSVFGDKGNIKGYDGFTIGWNDVIVPRASHHAVVTGYSYPALAPLWALELYCGNVLGMTPKLGVFADDMDRFEKVRNGEITLSKEEYAEYYDGFYPRLYAYMRDYLRQSEENGKKTNAQYMMQFAVGACHAAKRDLTDYFTKWGFFTGEEGCVVDPADREAALKEIKEAGYPPVTDAVEYITDDTWQLFRDKLEVVPGTARIVRSKNAAGKTDMEIRDYSNIVAYEIYDRNSKWSDGTDRLVRVLNPNANAGFDAKNQSFMTVDWKDNYYLCAVQYDGERIPVPVTVNI